MVSVVIPILNASEYLTAQLDMLREQSLPHELIIIDSGSTDSSLDIIKDYNAIVISIEKYHFNHGATRNLGLENAKNDLVVFLTQDAIPASVRTLERLVSAMEGSPDIAMAYGRQLPASNAKLFGRMARLFNYPAKSVIKYKSLIPELGIKTCSCSNSFAVYRKSDLQKVGQFPTDVILGEDVSVAARFILAGKAVAYIAESEVYHSHDYSTLQEFKRYFDIGVFHFQQRDVLCEFTKAESEGFKYFADELKYIIENRHFGYVPSLFIRTLFKYIGYKAGQRHYLLPIILKKNFSMHESFWR